MKIGSTLNKIRRNLQITQSELSKGIMTQGAYSKIEKGQLQVNAEQFFHLLSKMNISLNEFSFIMHEYNLDEKQRIIQDFISLELGDVSILQAHLQRINNLLVNESDTYLQSLSKIYKAFILLQDDKSLIKAREEIWSIWEKMQLLDHWYKYDFEVLNAILFLFPLDIAKEIKETAIKRLNKYNGYNEDLTYLKVYFNINLSVLYIEAKQFKECLHLLEQVESQFIQKMSYKSTATLFERKAICLFYLNQPYESELVKMEQLLSIYHDALTNSILKLEFNLLTGQQMLGKGE